MDSSSYCHGLLPDPLLKFEFGFTLSLTLLQQLIMRMEHVLCGGKQNLLRLKLPFS